MTIDFAESFALDYAGARAKFRAAAAELGGTLSEYRHPTQKGPDGQDLIVDVARLGDAEAPSQLVVDALLDTAWNLQAGHPDKADRSLQAPVFAFPKRTLQVLAALPYIPSANLATSEAASQALSHGDTHR